MHHPRGSGEDLPPPVPAAARAGLADLVAGAAWAALAGAFFAGALRMPIETALWTWYKAPGLVPALLSAALLGQAAGLIVRGARRWRDARGAAGLGEAASVGGAIGWGRAAGWRGLRREAAGWGLGRVAVALAFAAGFVVAMGRLPFGVLIVLLVFGMTVAFRGASPARAALVAVITAAAVVLVFSRLFFVPLP